MSFLRFASEEERLEHPFARLIPKVVWDEVFLNQLDELELGLMAAPAEDARIRLASESYSSLRGLERQRCLLALLFSEPPKGQLFYERSMAIELHGLFLNAASTGHLPVINRLIEIAPDKVQEMVAARFYEAFCNAAINGHLPVINRLIEIAPDKVQEMVAANGYEAFRSAAYNGHLPVINRLIELAPDKVQAMVSANGYVAFRNAASTGHLPVINRLIEIAPDKVQEMVAADGYAAFRNAAYNAHLPVINRLIEIAPDKAQEMVEADGYAAFRSAASNGHLPVINRLIEIAPDKVQAMVATNGYKAFRRAASAGHLPVINRLLLISGSLAFAEMHDHEYGARYVHSFIQTTLTTLRGEIAVFEQEHLNGVFDIIDPEKTQLCFYMIRNLIRRNDATLLDDLRFLLRIPAVKALAHTAVTPGEPNELMRLALTVGNQGAAEILLTIPAVRVLTEQNNFYRTERQRGIDLAALARDRESSMRALSTDEQRRLKKATDKYEPLMKTAGVPHIMSELRETLESRYDAHPALLTLDNQEIIRLPMDWTSFNQLTLNPEEKARALTAYYQNKDHSAWRYLSKPNPWMAPNASYVYVNPDNHAERWSTFEEYQPLISMLYLAATDVSTPATDGWTIETRVEHFIDELAHIGRAHNWDDTRERTDAQGEVFREEYDNLQGDKPSCFSGVNRRLFQSVMGHPLLTFLTLNGVKQELREFMREHFKELIKALGSGDLGKVWATFCETGRCTSDWDALNVPTEKQAAFLAHLALEYKTEFTDYPKFIKYVHDSFLITPIYPAHVVRFAGETSFGDLLPNIIDAAIDEPQPISASTAPALGIEALKVQLATLGALGVSMNEELDCLVNAATSTWKVWHGAGDKLVAITSALACLSLRTKDDLHAALHDSDSDLSKALNQKPTADKTFRSKIYDVLDAPEGSESQSRLPS